VTRDSDAILRIFIRERGIEAGVDPERDGRALQRRDVLEEVTRVMTVEPTRAVHQGYVHAGSSPRATVVGDAAAAARACAGIAHAR
jgi:hypothetical protein